MEANVPCNTGSEVAVPDEAETWHDAPCDVDDHFVLVSFHHGLPGLASHVRRSSNAHMFTVHC